MALELFIFSMAIFLLGTAIVLFMFFDAVQTRSNALVAATTELIQQMEKASASSWRGRAKRAQDTTAKFAVDGARDITEASRILISKDGTNPYNELTKAGIMLMEQQRSENINFLKERGNLRGIVLIYLTLVKDKNIDAAFDMMIDYMIKQRDAGYQKLPNFTLFKKVLGVHESYPKGDEPETCKQVGLSVYNYALINFTLSSSRQKVIDAMIFYPPTPEDKEEIIIRGENVFDSMRRFLSASIESLYREYGNE